MHEHVDDDRLLDFVGGYLAPPDQTAALDHARACDECAARLQTYAATHEIARARAVQAVSAARAPLPRTWWRDASLRRYGSIAAMLFVASTASFVWWTTTHRVPPSARAIDWLPSPDPSVLTRGSANAEAFQQIGRGLAAYRAHDAATAVSLLEAVQVDGPLEQVRVMYLGNALLQTNRAREALRVLRSLSWNLIPEPWNGEAQWSLSLAMALSGETESADSLLTALSARQDDIGERARRAPHP
jgi:hypothetical protein